MGTKTSEALSYGLRQSASFGKIFGITGSGFYSTMMQFGIDGDVYSDVAGITPGQTLTVFNGGTSTTVMGNSTAFITGAFGGDGRYLTNINASSIEAAGDDQMVQYNASDRFAGVTDFRYMSASANTLKGAVSAKALVMGDTATTDVSASGFGLFHGGLRLGEDKSIGTSAKNAMITLNGDSSIVSVPVEAQFGTSLSVTGGATVAGVLTANGNVNIGNAASDILSITSTITASGESRFTNTLSADGNVNLGNSATADTVQITANLTASSGAKFNKGVTIDTEGLTVSAGGATVTAGGLTVSAGETKVGASLSVTGAAGFGAGATIAAGGLTVTAGETKVGASLSVTGGATFANTLTANGNVNIGNAATDILTITSTVTASGEARFTNTLSADGNVNLGNSATADTVTITANLTASSGAKFNKGVTIDTEGLTVSAGGATITAGGLTVSAGETKVGASLSVTGAATIGGTLLAAGDVDLGNATSDTISFVGRIDTDIVPSTDSARNLGTPSLRWQNVYTGDLHLRNERGDWTLFEEADHIKVRNNLTGKLFRMALVADE
jgi:membrane-bound inhibitor of C-type lysozyme